jgi:hypothetical protein
MNPRITAPVRLLRRSRHRAAVEKLDASLARATQTNNTGRIQLLRRAYFADVDALERSGTVKLPD